MKKKVLLLTLSLLGVASASFAQTFDDGYYRLQNAATSRYVAVVDNRASINMQSTDADLQAIHTYKDFDHNIVSNPGSIIYAKKEGDGYDLYAQGVSTYDMVGYYLRVHASRTTPGAYWAYATSSGFTKYVTDPVSDLDESFCTTSDRNGRDWYIKPVTTEGDNYFGLRPTCDVGDKHYQPFYASFPFSFASSGMKAYYVTKYGGDMAVMKEWTGEDVPASMPLFIACDATEPTDNRFNLLTSSKTSKPGDNILQGTYFDLTWPKSHANYVANDPATIRMLGVTSTGELGFVAKPDLDVVPANTAYLKVAPGTPDELRLVTEEEYTTGIVGVEADATETVGKKKRGVYKLTGVKVSDGDELPANLPRGIYIVDGKKVAVK